MSSIREILNNPEALEKTTVALFEETDTNKDGTVSIDELQALFERLSEEWNFPCPPTESIQAGLKAIDQNNDGVLSVGEFKALVIDVLNVLANSEES